MKLKEYLHKKIKLKDKEGYIWFGKVFTYTKADDNPNGNFAEIDLDVESTNKGQEYSKELITFNENEIAEIEEIK